MKLWRQISPAHLNYSASNTGTFSIFTVWSQHILKGRQINKNMTGKFSPLKSDTKLTRQWKLKTKVYTKKILKLDCVIRGKHGM